MLFLFRRHRGGLTSLFLIIFISSSVSSQERPERQRSVSEYGDQTLTSSFFFYQRAEYPRDCLDVLSQCPSSRNDGVYVIKPDGYPEPFEVYCNNSLGDGGWTVIQRREDNSINFNRTWDEYEHGFGFLAREFWLGNDKICYITNQRKYQLRMDLTTASGISFFVTYETFRISDSFSHYKLVCTGEYTGAADTNLEWCPSNKVVNRCKCEGSCADHTCTESCSNTPTCVCPDGFLMDGEDCIPREDCGCFIEEAENGQGVVLAEGEVYVNPSCTKRCSCNNGLLSCDDTYRCSPNGNCEVRQSILQCYCNTGYTGDGVRCFYTDCGILRGEISNSIQSIQPAGQDVSFQVTCDVTDGGGWLVFQRRVDSSVDFYLYWDDYKNGFGDFDGNFWLGNDKLAALTSQTQYELRIDFVSKSGEHYYAKYSSFSVGNEGTNYLLSVSGYDSSSTVGYDAMSYHNGEEFSTRDEDNDDASTSYAGTLYAEYYTSAWWYGITGRRCDLNRPYTGSYTIYWNRFPGGNYNIRSTEMKIRPRT